jgi:dTDP-4-amino-4,6-dideoxygalactose transaminase
VSVPLVDLGWQHRQVEDEVRTGWDQVLADTSFIQGKPVGAFEQELAAYLGGEVQCIGVANGTDALEIALRALGVGPGDTVALPANTFVATAFAVARCGAEPRLVDVDSQTLLMDPEKLDVGGCKVVVPVHLYGQLAPMEALLDAAGDVPVLEDAAQSQGATQDGRSMGTFGAAAATSFYPGKNLGAYGDGGAVLSTDPELADRMRLIANHGSSVRYVHETLGFNSRLDTLQAVVLSAKLRRLDEWNGLRREAARRYDELLAGEERVRRLQTAAGNEHVWHLYPVRVPDRDAVLAGLHERGIGAAIHYPTPVHLQQAFAHLGLAEGAFPVAEEAARTQLSLPLYPGITADQQQQVVEALLASLR